MSSHHRSNTFRPELFLRILGFAVLPSFSAVLLACQLMPILEEQPDCWRDFDRDGDGYAGEFSKTDPNKEGSTCEETCGNAGGCGPFDCNDDASAIHPGAFDDPGNGVDEDCDCVDADPDPLKRFLDRDGDGFADVDRDGDGAIDIRCCPEGDERCSSKNYDCNDDDPERWNGHADLDGDGEDDARCGGPDCDDGRPDIFSGANGKVPQPYCGTNFLLAHDGNCDGVTDSLSECTCISHLDPSSAQEALMYESGDQNCDMELRFDPSPETIHPGICRAVFATVSPDEPDFFYHVFAACGDVVAYYVGLKAERVGGGEIDYSPTRVWNQSEVVETGPVESLAIEGNSVIMAGNLGIQRYLESSQTLYYESFPFPILQPQDVFVAFHYAFVVSPTGLHIIELLDPSNQELVATIDSASLTLGNHQSPPPFLTGVFVRNQLAYVSGNALEFHGLRDERLSGFFMFDVGNTEGAPEHPVILIEHEADQFANDVFVTEDKLFLASADGLTIVELDSSGIPDFSNGENYHIDLRAEAHDVFVTGELAYVATEEGLYIVDIAELGRVYYPVVAEPEEIGVEAPSRSVMVVQTHHHKPEVGDEWYIFVATDVGLIVVNLSPELYPADPPDPPDDDSNP